MSTFYNILPSISLMITIGPQHSLIQWPMGHESGIQAVNATIIYADARTLNDWKVHRSVFRVGWAGSGPCKPDFRFRALRARVALPTPALGEGTVSVGGLLWGLAGTGMPVVDVFEGAWCSGCGGGRQSA